MAKFILPNGLDFTRPQLWLDWKQRWKRFHVATQLGAKDGEVQVSPLIHTMGQEAETIYENFIFDDEEDRDSHPVVLAKFDAHFIQTVNVILERAKLHRRVQQPDENIENYIRSLYDLALT